MLSYKLVIFCALCCLVQCSPLTEDMAVNKYKKVMSSSSHTCIKDGEDKPVTEVFTNVTIYNDDGQSRDPELLSNFVAGKLQLLELRSDESIHESYVEDKPLPLLFNETLIELITTGPKPVQKTLVMFSFELYAKKQKYKEALSVIRSTV